MEDGLLARGSDLKHRKVRPGFKEILWFLHERTRIMAHALTHPAVGYPMFSLLEQWPCALLAAALAVSGCAEPTAPRPDGGGETLTLPSIHAGWESTCARMADDELLCWGVDLGTQDRDSLPKALSGNPGFEILSLAHGLFGLSGCGIDGSSRTYCWGLFLGIDLYQSYGAAPILILDSIPLTSVVSGPGHACGLASDGQAYCWGSYFRGKRGQGGPFQPTGSDLIADLTPNRVAGGIAFVTLAAGDDHTCGIAAANDLVYCWGAGELMGGPSAPPGFDDECVWTPCVTTPTLVEGLPQVIDLTIGSGDTCVLSGNGGVRCWGANEIPRSVSLPQPARHIVAGAYHRCALASDGSVYCWGSNSHGQLGSPGPDATTPRRVNTSLRFVSLSAGGRHTCGVTPEAGMYCWGANYHGQLGNGTTTDSPIPVKVLASQP